MQIHIPHRLWSGFASSFLVIKGAPHSSLKTHLSPPLKAICSIAQLSLGIYFLPQFLRKLICGLIFVISFHQWELFVDARGRRLLPNLVKFMVFYICYYFLF